MPITEADSAPARSLAVIGVLTYSAILVGLSLLAAWLISGPVGSTISNCFALVLVMLVGTGRKTLKAAYGTALMSFMAIVSGIVFSAVFIVVATGLKGDVALAFDVTSLSDFDVSLIGAVLVVFTAHFVAHFLVRAFFWRELAGWV